MHTLHEVMSTEIPALTVEDNVFEAALLMKKHNATLVPILENGQIKGIVRDRDIVVNGVAEKHPNSSDVTEVMSTEFVSGEPSMSVKDAKHIMIKAKVWEMPVIEADNVIGIICLSKLLRS